MFDIQDRGGARHQHHHAASRTTLAERGENAQDPLTTAPREFSSLSLAERQDKGNDAVMRKIDLLEDISHLEQHLLLPKFGGTQMRPNRFEIIHRKRRQKFISAARNPFHVGPQKAGLWARSLSDPAWPRCASSATGDWQIGALRIEFFKAICILPCRNWSSGWQLWNCDIFASQTRRFSRDAMARAATHCLHRSSSALIAWIGDRPNWLPNGFIHVGGQTACRILGGVEKCESIRNFGSSGGSTAGIAVFHERAPSIPLVAISGYTFSDQNASDAVSLNLALRLGATRCLRKPFGPATLLGVIDECLSEIEPHRKYIATLTAIAHALAEPRGGVRPSS